MQSPTSTESPDEHKSLFRVKIAILFGVFFCCWLAFALKIARNYENAILGVAGASAILMYFVRCESCHSSIYYRKGGVRKFFGSFDYYKFALSGRCPCCGRKRI
jgi:hypothetical protein